jgi:hypothetical protein
MRNGFVQSARLLPVRWQVSGSGRVAAMKIHVDIDCTPEEARAFLGLPDVGPMQSALMAELQQRMMANLQAMEPEQLFKTWLPAGIQGWEQLQKAFWSQMSGGPGDKKAGDRKEGK